VGKQRMLQRTAENTSPGGQHRLPAGNHYKFNIMFGARIHKLRVLRSHVNAPSVLCRSTQDQQMSQRHALQHDNL